MSLASVIANLYSGSTFKNVSVTSGVAESIKIGLKTRFSLVGLVGTLTGSKALLSIARQKYFNKEMQKEEYDGKLRDEQFKTGVLRSISSLTKQVDLLESITIKNSAMISMISNDLGYFKSERRNNFLRQTTALNLSAIRMPLNQRTVKGKLEIIEQQIKQLKGLKTSDKLSDKEKTNFDAMKTIAGIAAGGGLAAALIAQGITGSKLTAIIAGLAGAISAPVLAKLAFQIAKYTIPVVGSAAKTALLLPFASDALSTMTKSLKGENPPPIKPNPHALGTPEHAAFELEQNFEMLKYESYNRIGAPLLLLGTAYFGAKTFKGLGGVAAIKGAGNLIKRMNAKARMRDFASKRAAVTASRAAYAERMRVSGQNVIGQKFSEFDIGKSNRVLAAEEGRRLTGLRRTIRGAGPSLRYRTRMTAAKVAGLGNLDKGMSRIAKMLPILEKASQNKFLRKVPLANISLATLIIANMITDYNELKAGSEDMPYSKYKQRMTDNLGTLFNTLGATAIGGLLGAVIGTAIFPPGGGLAGALLGGGIGFAASIAASLMSESSGLDEYVGGKLFNIFFADEKLAAEEKRKTEAAEARAPTSSGRITGLMATPEEIKLVSENGDAQVAMDFFISKGYTEAAAAGIVGNLIVESNLKTDIIGDGGKAYGIAQWHPDRQAKFAEVYGKPIQTTTFKEQLEYIDWELNNTERRAGELLVNVVDPSYAAAIVDSKYERSSGIHIQRRIDFANALYNENYSDIVRSGGRVTANMSMMQNRMREATAALAGTTVAEQEMQSQILEYFAKDSASVASPPDSADTTAADAMAAAVAAQAGTMMVANNLKELGDQTQSGFAATRGAIDGARAADKIPKEPAERMRDDSFDDKFVYA